MYLLTGGHGVLGTELRKHLDCWCPDRSVLDVRYFDSEAGEELRNDDCEEEFKNIDCIIHAAAWTDVPGAEIDKKAAVETNIIGTHNVAKFAKKYGYRLVYISTDYVYPGHVGNYDEESKTEPFNFYGFTKLAGEAFVDLETDLIIRTSFKPGDLWETKYNKAFIDLYTSAEYVDVVAPDIALAIKHNLKGMYNIAGERKAIYELAQSRIPGVGEMSRWDVSNWIKLPSDISMNIDKFRKFKQEKLDE